MVNQITNDLFLGGGTFVLKEFRELWTEPNRGMNIKSSSRIGKKREKKEKEKKERERDRSDSVMFCSLARVKNVSSVAL